MRLGLNEQTPDLIWFLAVEYFGQNIWGKIMRYLSAIFTASLFLTGCSDFSADKDGDGIVNKEERSFEMNSDAFIEIEHGLWETKAIFDKADMPGVPQKLQIKLLEELSSGLSSKSCVTEQDANTLDADFFGGEGAENCDYKQFDISGNNADIIVSCKIDDLGIVDVALKGNMQAKTNEFETVLTMKMAGVGEMKFTGITYRNHIGECPDIAAINP